MNGVWKLSMFPKKNWSEIHYIWDSPNFICIFTIFEFYETHYLKFFFFLCFYYYFYFRFYKIAIYETHYHVLIILSYSKHTIIFQKHYHRQCILSFVYICIISNQLARKHTITITITNMLFNNIKIRINSTLSRYYKNPLLQNS